MLVGRVGARMERSPCPSLQSTHPPGACQCCSHCRRHAGTGVVSPVSLTMGEQRITPQAPSQRTACPAARSRPPRSPRCRSGAVVCRHACACGVSVRGKRATRAATSEAQRLLNRTRLSDQRAVCEREQLRVLVHEREDAREAQQERKQRRLSCSEPPDAPPCLLTATAPSPRASRCWVTPSWCAIAPRRAL